MKFWRGIPRWRRYRAGARLLILILAAVTGFLFAFLIQTEHYGWAFVVALVLGLLSIFEFVVADLIVESRFPRETRKFLEVLQDRLASTPINEEIVRHLSSCVQSFRGCDRQRISSTVHLRVGIVAPDDDRQSAGLIQISDYTRAGLGGRRWRVLDSTKGIVGRCLRLEETVWVNFRSVEEYRLCMVREFGFSREEAEGHTKTARSYLAHPVRHQDSTIGVLFFFSQEPQVFPRAADSAELERAAADVVGTLRTAGVL